MRRALPFAPAGTPRLFERRWPDRTEFWTETVGQLPPVAGERWTRSGGRELRAIDPNRSKLGAAVTKGGDGPLPRPGASWLYLGAASGTTASHVADLVGPDGTVFAVEKSLRPFARLLGVAERWPNLLPLLEDARRPEEYADLVGTVDGIYADIAQPDQVGLLLRHAELFLAEPFGAVVLALKTPSLGREPTAAGHLREAEHRLGADFDVNAVVRLEPFHRGHYLIGAERRGTPTADRRYDPARRPNRPSSARRPRTRFAPRPGRRRS